MAEKRPLQHRLRREAREVFNELPKNFQEMYRFEQCQMCGAHMTVRQMNRVILQGVPPICSKDYKRFEGQVEQAKVLFDQLSLL